MALNKYKGFLPGQKLPAENVNSIDPENIDPQAVGYLTGGTGHSALSVFQALANGANDGKIKINVDGNVYDDVYLNFNKSQGVEEVVVSANPASSNTNNISGQSFNSNVVSKIKSITISSGGGGAWQAGTRTLTLREGKNAGGTILGTATATGGVVGNLTFTFPTPIELQKGQSYSFFWDGSQYIYYNTGNAPDTSVDDYYRAGSFQDGYVNFSITGDKWFQLSDFDDLATLLQFVIREETLSTETVIYDTDHFVITSGHAGSTSQILKLMTPTSGTDISGAGAIPYLDCADNATETLGTGEDFNLARLDENGQLPVEILENSYRKTNEDLAELYDDFFQLIASETLRTSSDAEVSSGTSEADFVKRKEIQFNYFVRGTIRVKYSIRENNTSANATFQLRKNGVVLFEETQNSTTYALKTHDIEVERGDLIQIYIKNTATYAGQVKEFRLYYDLSNRYITADTVVI